MKKYLHVLEQTSPEVTRLMINMFNDLLSLKDSSTFITHKKDIADMNSNEGNVLYSADMVNFINENYTNYDYIFIHAMNFSITELMRINREAKKKFIWLSWGHDLYGYDTNIVLYILKQIKLRFRMLFLRNICGVAYSFDYDKNRVYEILPKRVKTFHLPYGYAINSDKSYLELFDENIKKDDKYTNVLIGHCGFNFINHIKTMKQIKKIYNHNIKINLVLSYGGPQKYIEKVKKFAYKNFDKNDINIIDKKMTEKEYIKFLSSIDVAVFEFKHSSALGNIYKLMYMGKKLYLNKDGILYKGMSSHKNLPVYRTQDICKSYDMFSKLLSKEEKQEYRKFACSRSLDSDVVKLWDDFFKQL